MAYGSNYPAGAANDSRAPWNREEYDVEGRVVNPGTVQKFVDAYKGDDDVEMEYDRADHSNVTITVYTKEGDWLDELETWVDYTAPRCSEDWGSYDWANYHEGVVDDAMAEFDLKKAE